VVVAREFGKRRALRTSPSCLGLLRRRQFRFPAQVLPTLLRPVAALGGADADKLALERRQPIRSSRVTITTSPGARLSSIRRSLILRFATNYQRQGDHLDRRNDYRYPGASLRDSQPQPHIGAMHLDLSDEETAALIQELHDFIESDRYPFSPRIRTLRTIINKLRPEPVREPLPPPKIHDPPRFIRGRRRRG
jgi:hypothetical protein